MGILDRINESLDGYIARQQTGPASGAPRRLTGDDMAAFEHAAEHRGMPRQPRVAARPRAPFVERMWLRNPNRMQRLQSDMRWLRKQAIKEGMDPESVRWLL